MRVYRKYFERITIIGPMFERKAALDHVVAEREIKKGE